MKKEETISWSEMANFKKIGTMTTFLIMEITTVMNQSPRPKVTRARTTRKPQTVTDNAGGLTSLGMAILIPSLILVFFFILLCCCLRMKARKRQPEETAEDEPPQPINLSPGADDQEFFSGYQQAPPSYDSLNVVSDDDAPPPSYDDFVLSRKGSLFKKIFGFSRQNSRRSTASGHTINGSTHRTHAASEDTVSNVNVTVSTPERSRRQSEGIMSQVTIMETVTEQTGNTNQGSTNRDNTIQESTNQENTNQGNINQGNTTQGNTNQGNINQGNINLGCIPAADELREEPAEVQAQNIQNACLTNAANSDNLESERRVSVINIAF